MHENRKVVVIALFGIFAVIPAGLIVFQNHTYASKVFANNVAYNQVLASRKWHTSTLGCGYAIVSLEVGASHSPPKQWLGNEPWSRAPVRLARPIHHDDTTNPVSVCVAKGEFSSDVATRLQDAVKEQGSYYIHLGETLFLHSEPKKTLQSIVMKTDGDVEKLSIANRSTDLPNVRAYSAAYPDRRA